MARSIVIALFVVVAGIVVWLGFPGDDIFRKNRAQVEQHAATVAQPVLPGDKVRTEQQAIAIAQDFMTKVGWTVSTAEPTVKSPRQDSLPEEDRWEVKIGAYKAEIDSLTGQVRSAFHRDAIAHKQIHDKFNLDAKKALSLTRKYLACTGITLDESAKVETNALNTRFYDPGLWEISFNRYYQGYQIIGDFITVYLNPTDGKLIGFGYHFDAPLPDSVDIKIDKKAADKRIQNNGLSKGITLGNLKSARLLIANKRTHRKEDGKEVRSNKSNLVWLLTYAEYNTFIDANTGEIMVPLTRISHSGDK